MLNNLDQKHCVPCEGGAAPLKREEAQEYLKQLKGWQLAETAGSITRSFTARDFAGALEMVEQVGRIAETEGHHPDITLHSYKQVTITLATHAIGGLSENDFIVAAKIDRELDPS